MTWTNAAFANGVVVQVMTMLPALIFTPSVLRGKSPYALILVSMITLVYLGVAGVLALIRYYEAAPSIIWHSRLIEFVVICFVNYYLFVFLKRLPPMHKHEQSNQL